MKALVYQGRVVQVAKEDFPVALPMEWIDCDATVKENWLWDGQTFSAPALPQAGGVNYREKRRSEYKKLDADAIEVLRDAVAALSEGKPVPKSFTEYAKKIDDIKKKYPA